MRFTPARRRAFLEGLRRGLTVRGAAAAAGIADRTVYDHTRDDPAFADAVEVARGEAEARLLEQVTNAAESKAPRSWEAAAWILERRWPKEYGRRDRVAVGGDPAAPPLKVVHDPPTDERLTAVLVILQDLGRLPRP